MVDIWQFTYVYCVQQVPSLEKVKDCSDDWNTVNKRGRTVLNCV